MTTIITIPQQYGYVVAIALVATPLLAFAHTIISATKRRSADCPYPNAYASPQEVKTNPAAYSFNCAQRAHAHFMEHAPQTMLMMLVAGVMYPRATTVLGLGWLASRALFLYGYVFIDKEKGNGRKIGMTFILFQAGLWGLVAMTAKNLML